VAGYIYLILVLYVGLSETMGWKLAPI